MYILLVIVHVIVCLVLIAVILLQAGRGAGLTEAFGGEAAQNILGTSAPVILKRATEVCAIMFLITSLLLAMATSRRGQSLVMNSGGRMQGMPISSQEGAMPSEAAQQTAAQNVPASDDQHQPADAF